MVKWVIFDFDGTMVDSLSIILKSQGILSKKYGYQNIAYSKHLREKTFREILRKDMNLNFFEMILFLNRFSKVLDYEIQEIELVQGISNLIKELKKKGYQLGLVSTNISNDARNNIIKFLERNNLYESFGFIEHASFLRGKSYKLTKILHKYQIRKTDLVYVGDQVSDVIATKKAGINIIAVTWGFNSRKFLANNGAKIIVDKPSEILDVVEKLQS